MSADPKDTDIEALAAPSARSGGRSCKSDFTLALLMVVSVCAIVMVGELASLVSFASSGSTAASSSLMIVDPATGKVSMVDTSSSSAVKDEKDDPPRVVDGVNVCEGKKPDFPNVDCIVDAMTNVGPQAGANVTKGYNGTMTEGVGVPITTPYWMKGMCAVNVHWHLGAEHLSVGEYDETGNGPAGIEGLEAREGHQCTMYDASDEKFTKEYDWKWCKDMSVGQTYEVHWPHSAAGACGTLNQYQTPFYDGVFCTDGVITDTAAQIGVQAQVFIVVNDDSYFWPDLMRGMIVDGEMGVDLAMYTGSTTGDARSNEVCSQYTPITWQVDRKCHMMAASAFDKLCHDMLQQRDDMSEDIHPHGSRETVADELAAANHANRM